METVDGLANGMKRLIAILEESKMLTWSTSSLPFA